jgi:putative membrane protein
MMGSGWGFFGIIWMLVPLLFLGGLVAIIVWAVTQLTSGRRAAGSAGVHDQSAEEILRQRFARGEIDAGEYEERRRILNEQHHREEEGPKK